LKSSKTFLRSTIVFYVTFSSNTHPACTQPVSLKRLLTVKREKKQSQLLNWLNLWSSTKCIFWPVTIKYRTLSGTLMWNCWTREKRKNWTLWDFSSFWYNSVVLFSRSLIQSRLKVQKVNKISEKSLCIFLIAKLLLNGSSIFERYLSKKVKKQPFLMNLKLPTSMKHK
jgi:hypothetical protein